MSLVLAERIIRAHPDGFVGAIVEGKRGVGKSSYCIKIMKEVYQELYSLDDDTAYDKALEHLVFDIDDIIDICKKARQQHKMVPVLTWDDAGVHGSNIQWFINMHGVQELRALVETIRVALTGFLINCTSRHGLLKHLREQDDYIINIIKVVGYNRAARGYNLYKLPSGMTRVYRNFEDRYSCYLPKRVYQKYLPIRESYLDKAIETMSRMKDRFKAPGRPPNDFSVDI